jgi:hypothetical protein
VAALATLSGPLHGTAADAVLDALDADDPAAALRDRAGDGPIPGFGHPLYDRIDPRCRRLLDVVRQAVGSHPGSTASIPRAVDPARRRTATERRPRPGGGRPAGRAAIRLGGDDLRSPEPRVAGTRRGGTRRGAAAGPGRHPPDGEPRSRSSTCARLDRATATTLNSCPSVAGRNAPTAGSNDMTS